MPTPDNPTASFNLLESLAVRSPADAWAGVFTTDNANGDFFVHWNEVRVELWTHATGGLHLNDFILAAKIDGVANPAAARG